MPTWNAIYLGNISGFNIDPTEGDFDSENAGQLNRTTFGSEEDPLYSHVVAVTTLDNSGEAGQLDTARATTGTPDQIEYDLGTGTQTQVFEGMAIYTATVTFADNSTATVSAVVFQDESGYLFLAPETLQNADAATYQSGPIVSLELTRVDRDTSDLDIFRNSNDFVACFSAGTLIETAEGLRPVEDLRAGDQIKTVDCGLQTLLWTGSNCVDTATSEALLTVRIKAGALGADLPSEDLIVSQQHRVLVRSAIAQRMFGTDEVLVAARQLVALPGIEIVEDAGPVTYVHLLFDRHQLLLSNGAVSESLFTGPQALKGVSAAARTEILELFPEIEGEGAEIEARRPVRPLIAGRVARKMAARHLSNHKPLYRVHAEGVASVR